MRRLLLTLIASLAASAACAQIPISGLPAATTPVGGTEVLPIVQGGVTKKIAEQDLGILSTMTVRNLPTYPGFKAAPSFIGQSFPGIGLLGTGEGLRVARDFGIADGPTDVDDMSVFRTANYTGGTNGVVNAALRTFDTVSAGAKAYEWTLNSVMDNSSTSGDGSQNLAANFTAIKRSTGMTWGVNEVLEDLTADPIATSVTNEEDLYSVGTDANSVRVIGDYFGKSQNSSATTISYGIRINAESPATITRGIRLNGAFVGGIDLSQATYSSNTAISLSPTQRVCLDVVCTRYMAESSGGVAQIVASAAPYSFKDTGVLALGGIDTTTGGLTNTVVLAAGQHICLDVGCSSYLYTNGGTGTFVVHVGGVDLFGFDTSGTFSAIAYKAGVGPSTGVSCSGTPTSSFASVGGIVTHC